MPVLQKALLRSPDHKLDAVYVQFNPNSLEYTVGLAQDTDKGVGGMTNLASQRQSSPIKEKHGGRLSVRLFFHTYTSELLFSDVRKHIEPLQAFLPHPVAGGKTETPRVEFAWGPMSYTGTVESFRVSYQMFAYDGTPVQAEVSLSIHGEDQDAHFASINRSLDPAADGSRLPDLEDPVSAAGLSWLFR